MLNINHFLISPRKNMSGYSHLPLSGLIQLTTNWSYHIFLIFPRKQDLILHANIFHWRQFARNVISCFLGKIRKTEKYFNSSSDENFTPSVMLNLECLCPTTQNCDLKTCVKDHQHCLSKSTMFSPGEQWRHDQTAHVQNRLHTSHKYLALF